MISSSGALVSKYLICHKKNQPFYQLNCQVVTASNKAFALNFGLVSSRNKTRASFKARSRPKTGWVTDRCRTSSGWSARLQIICLSQLAVEQFPGFDCGEVRSEPSRLLRWCLILISTLLLLLLLIFYCQDNLYKLRNCNSGPYRLQVGLPIRLWMAQTIHPPKKRCPPRVETGRLKLVDFGINLETSNLIEK